MTGNLIYAALVVTPESKGGTDGGISRPCGADARIVGAHRRRVKQAAVKSSTNAAYKAFWKPLEPVLVGAKRVYISPDGVLNTIPIGLMTDEDGKIVMEKYQLRIVNSTKDLLRPVHAAQLKSALTGWESEV